MLLEVDVADSTRYVRLKIVYGLSRKDTVACYQSMFDVLASWSRLTCDSFIVVLLRATTSCSFFCSNYHFSGFFLDGGRKDLLLCILRAACVHATWSCFAVLHDLKMALRKENATGWASSLDFELQMNLSSIQLLRTGHTRDKLYWYYSKTLTVKAKRCTCLT